MSSSSLSSLVLVSLVLVSLVVVSGCKPDTSQPFENPLEDIFNEVMISGKYTERKNGSTLAFEHGSATLKTVQGSMEKPVTVSGNKITLLMDAGQDSRIHRPNLELIIANDGEVLLCTACAAMGLDSHWYRNN